MVQHKSKNLLPKNNRNNRNNKNKVNVKRKNYITTTITATTTTTTTKIKKKLKKTKKTKTSETPVSCQPYIVNNILSNKTISNILHGIKEDNQEATSTTTDNTTPKRRLQRQTTKWSGILKIDNTTGKFAGITDLVNRGYGRSDYTLTESLVWDNLVCVEDKKKMNDLIQRLFKQYEQDDTTAYKTLHIMVIRPGADAQSYHCDDEEAIFYHTLAFPLTKDTKSAGYTEFEYEDKLPFKKAGRPGQCLVFDGKTSHRGLGNISKHPRVFFYVALHHCSKDGNLAVAGDDALYSEQIVKVRKCDAPHIIDSSDKGSNTTTVVNVGDIWKFHAEPGKKSYIGIIESILLNKRMKHTMLEVRWLYHEEEVKNKKRIKLQYKERLYSNHLDDVQLESLKRKVCNFVERYICTRVYDFEEKCIDTSEDAKNQLKVFLHKYLKRIAATAANSCKKRITSDF